MYLQMSWLEGETDVLEKLHGALTEVGLPACGTKHIRKKSATEIRTALFNKQDQIISLSCCQDSILSGENYQAISG